MTDRSSLTNREIKMMWSKVNKTIQEEMYNCMLVKCDLDGDGYIDFEEFKEMIMRSRERKELAKLREEAEMLAIEEITETVNTPDREEEIEEEIEPAEEQDNSDASVEEEIEDELEDEDEI